MLLRLWEDYWFFSRGGKELGAPFDFGGGGPVHHWPRFREYLLTRGKGGLRREEFFDKTGENRGLNLFAQVIEAWVTGSRRMYRLSAEMQEAFLRIDLGNIRCADILMPFPSFAIQLPVPFDLPSIKRGYPFVLVTQFRLPTRDGSFQGGIMVNMLSNDLLTYKPLNRERKLEITEAFDQRRPRAGNDFRKLLLDRGWLGFRPPFDEKWSREILFATRESSMTAREFMAEIPRYAPDMAEFAPIIQLVLNLAIYLASVPAQHENTEGKRFARERPEYPGNFKGVVIEETRVCDLGSRHILDSMIKDERTYKPHGSGYEAPPHWRRAHKRRPPGRGSDPLAEKTVRVRHTLVRADALPARGLPVGSVGIVKG